MKDISAGLMTIIFLLTCGLIYEFFADRIKFYAHLATIVIVGGLILLFSFLFRCMGFA